MFTAGLPGDRVTPRQVALAGPRYGAAAEAVAAGIRLLAGPVGQVFLEEAVGRGTPQTRLERQARSLEEEEGERKPQILEPVALGA